MRTKKQLIVYLTVCLVLSFGAAVYAAQFEIRSAPVTIVNNNSKPIPVTEVNKYPVQKEIAPKFNTYTWVVEQSLYTVPLDKRLVIEYFSCRNWGSYSTSYSCFISTGKYPDTTHHYLPTTPYGHAQMLGGGDVGPILNPTAIMSAGQRVQIYAEPGTEVVAGAFRQKQAIMSVYDYPEEYMRFSFSGYLLDIAP